MINGRQNKFCEFFIIFFSKQQNLDKFSLSKIEAQNSLKCLFVGQREYATVQFDDPFIDIVGSDDATTCHIVLIVDESNSNCSLCHFDGSDLDGGVKAMTESLKLLNSNSQTSHTYSLYIVGGFDDSKHSSIELTVKLFGITIF